MKDRIVAMILRYYYAWRDPSRMIEFICWPVIDIGFFGLIAIWSGSITGDANITRIFITALVLWQVIYRNNLEVAVNVLDEFLDQNLVNLIASPLRKQEWVISMMISGALKSVSTIAISSFVGWLFFGVNVFVIGWTLLPFIILSILSGWIIGFFGASFIIYKGAKLQQLPWVVVMIAAIFSAIFYPVDILPNWLQVICLSLPMSYIFQGMRELLTTSHINFSLLGWSAALSLIYLAIAIKVFLFMFEKSRKRGFKRAS